ncbi:MAG: hypothetical protein D6679_08810 [Candidatus Hydrogenedentota bacterium]|nr:MAG: hypothetical protein D6679_08810 [Candidatus Hydrogenedentota bacterium]
MTVYEELLDVLRSLGLKEGDVVAVHSDASAFGVPKDLRPLVAKEGVEALFRVYTETLIAAVGRAGTLLMPTFTYSACSGELYDVAETPSTVGALTDYFRRYPGVKRSRHPIFSYAGLGPAADELLRIDSYECFGPKSFFAKMFEHDFLYLMFGIPIQKGATCVYASEEKYGVPYRYYKDFWGPIKDGTEEFRVKSRYYVRYRELDIDDSWQDLEEELVRRDLARRTTFHGAPLVLFRARDIDRVIGEKLKEDRFYLISFLSRPREQRKWLRTARSRVKYENVGTVKKTSDFPRLLREYDEIRPVGDGLVVYGSKVTRLFSTLDFFILQMAKELGAKEVKVPAILDQTNAARSQYLNSFKHQALTVQSVLPESHFRGLASPTVCYHIFSSLAKKRVPHNGLIFTSASNCFRNEQSEGDILDRLRNFWMREIVVVGDAAFCKERLEEILEKTRLWFRDILDLDFGIYTAADPFFGEDSKIKQSAQLLEESKMEFRLTIPHLGKRIAAVSVNNHGQVFYSRFEFELSAPNDVRRCSGCVGWGFDRILYALMAQKGVDLDNEYYREVEQVRRRLEEEQTGRQISRDC